VIISASHVSRVFQMPAGPVAAVRDVSLDIAAGEHIAVRGPSGCGKSTLLHMLGCVDTPSGGTLLFEDHDVATLSDRERSLLRLRSIGFVFQRFFLLPMLSAAENVELPMSEAGMAAAERRQRARELLDYVGLSARADHRPSQLSGGEMQRVAIARALANRPRLLLADEPTGELDSQTASEVFAVLRGLNNELGVTIVVVTHDPAIANQIDRVVAIRDGRISTESFRRIAFEGREAYVYHDEYAVVDRTGRLQIPKEYLERIDVTERARLRMGAGQVEILPEDVSLEDMNDGC
jgi:ABC-type lipoprotein export system ATPase subunit